MVFNSLTFVVFFAVVLALHNLPLSWTVKKFNLLAASYLFYAAWNPPFVLLLMVSAVVDYWLARWIGVTQRPAARRALLACSLLLNLGLLGYFKYGTFVLANFVALLGSVGIEFHPAAPNIILPLGISFYTFETISYLVDVYRKNITPWRSFLDYALFLTFFPHLVAGPIVRAHDFLPQCAQPRQANSSQMAWGFCLMLLGLFEKVVLADGVLAPIADRVYNSAWQAGWIDAWTGTLAFGGQIFLDFAGYSTCGIGAALCLGFVLNDNFRFPYAAIGFSDFWQRWHISLSSWLRDYLYIPLGGNRRGPVRSYCNLVIVMLLGGLWHGAAWRFMAWGGLHGSYLVGERLLSRRFGNAKFVGDPAMRLLLGLTTFVLVLVAWVPFRAPDFATAWRLLTTMLTPTAEGSLLLSSNVRSVLLVVGGLLACHWVLRDSSLEDLVARIPWWVRSLALVALMLCLVLTPGDNRAFIYFQF